MLRKIKVESFTWEELSAQKIPETLERKFCRDEGNLYFAGVMAVQEEEVLKKLCKDRKSVANLIELARNSRKVAIRFYSEDGHPSLESMQVDTSVHSKDPCRIIVKVKIKGSQDEIAEADLEFRIVPPLQICSSYIQLQAGVETNHPLPIIGGLPPYQLWQSDTLKTCLQKRGLGLLNTTIVGIPHTYGKEEFTLNVHDQLTQYTEKKSGVEAKIAIHISPEDDYLKIMTESLPLALQGETYAVQLSAEGGTPPYLWKIVSESPHWLNLWYRNFLFFA